MPQLFVFGTFQGELVSCVKLNCFWDRAKWLAELSNYIHAILKGYLEMHKTSGKISVKKKTKFNITFRKVIFSHENS